MDYLRQLLAKVRLVRTDEELGEQTAVYPNDRRQSVNTHDETNCPVIETSGKLVEYRMLVGSK